MPAACITQESAEALPDAEISTIIHSFHEIGGLTTHHICIFSVLSSLSLSLSLYVYLIYIYIYMHVYI